MTILIKDMKMPFTCLDCDFHKCAGGVGDFCSLTKRRQFRFKNRPKNCPLIELPEPHGNLIDRDALWVEINKICDRHDAGIITDLTCLQQILSVVRHAPTIIQKSDKLQKMSRRMKGE